MSTADTTTAANGSDPAAPYPEPSSTYPEDVVELHHPDGRTSQAVVTVRPSRLALSVRDLKLTLHCFTLLAALLGR